MSTKVITEKKKNDFFLVHVIITFLFMFGFGYLTPIGTITPIGMKLLGIFLGVVYAWTTTTLIWPSLLGIVAVGMSGIMPMLEFFKMSFAHETVVFILFIFIFVTVLNDAGLVSCMANWFLSLKFIYGRPWLFTFVFLFGAFVCGALVNEIAATLIFWSIYYTIAEKFGFKPYDKYSTLIILGIAFAAVTAGGSTFPFKLGPMVWIASYASLTGEAVNFGQFICFSIPMACLTILLYTLIMRFVFKPDISALKKLDGDFVDKAALILNKKQKVAFGFLIAMIVLLLGPDFLPKDWAIVELLTTITKPGIIMLLIVLMFFFKFDGQPLMNFPKMGAGISWDIYLLFALILPLSTLLTSDATGIKPFLVGIIGPLLSGQSALMFAFLVLFSGFIITNFANNVVLGIIYINIMCTVAATMGVNVFPIVAVMVFTIQYAYLTPAGSAPSAMVFGNSAWVRAKDLFVYVPIIFFILFVITFIVGMPFANIIFR